jgi:F-box protein 28
MPRGLLSGKETGYHGIECVSATSTAKTYLCLDSSPLASASKGDESPNPANGIEEQAPEPLPQSNMVLRKRIRKIKQGMKRYAIVLIF